MKSCNHRSRYIKSSETEKNPREIKLLHPNFSSVPYAVVEELNDTRGKKSLAIVSKVFIADKAAAIYLDEKSKDQAGAFDWKVKIKENNDHFLLFLASVHIYQHLNCIKKVNVFEKKRTNFVPSFLIIWPRYEIDQHPSRKYNDSAVSSFVSSQKWQNFLRFFSRHNQFCIDIRQIRYHCFVNVKEIPYRCF